MNTQDAIQFLAGVVYKPGWTFTVIVADDVAMVVEIGFEAPNSDVLFAPEYTEDIDASQTHVLVHSECETQADMIRRVFELVLDVELHEMREFFSVGGAAYWKPLHPHTREGRQLWERWRTEALMV